MTNLAMVEQMIRRIIQVEVAVGRNVRFPDFSGLDVVMTAPTTSTGAADMPKFNEWVTNRLKEQANIWKQTRLYREERPHYGRGDADARDEGGGGGKSDKGKGRAARKAAAKAAAAAAAAKGSGAGGSAAAPVPP